MKPYTLKSKNILGFAIIESLIAFIVLGVGLLVLLNFNNISIQSTGDTKARLEAMTIAQDKMNNLRSFLDNDTDAADSDDDDGDGGDLTGRERDDWVARMVNGNDTVNGDTATFTRRWTIVDNGNLLDANVTVSWTDRDNQTQSYVLTSEIFDVDPRTAAKVLHTAIAAYYNPETAPSSESPDEPEFSSLDNDRAAEEGTWTIDVQEDGDPSNDITYTRRITMSGNIQKKTQNLVLPDPQVFGEDGNSSYIECDFGSTASTVGSSVSISLASGETLEWETLLVYSLASDGTETLIDQSTYVYYAADSSQINVPGGSSPPSPPFPYVDDNSITIGSVDVGPLTILANGTIEAEPDEDLLGNKYVVRYGTSANACTLDFSGTICPLSTTVEIELEDGFYQCYGYYQADVSADGTTGGFSGTLLFEVQSPGKFCFPITGVFAPKSCVSDPDPLAPVTSGCSTSALGLTSFYKMYQHIDTDQTLFLQLINNANSCAAQL